jgi:hypothetical protein
MCILRSNSLLTPGPGDTEFRRVSGAEDATSAEPRVGSSFAGQSRELGHDRQHERDSVIGEVLTGVPRGREPYRIVGYLDSRRRLGL